VNAGGWSPLVGGECHGFTSVSIAPEKTASRWVLAFALACAAGGQRSGKQRDRDDDDCSLTKCNESNAR
jgi:hypothetical protein